MTILLNQYSIGDRLNFLFFIAFLSSLYTLGLLQIHAKWGDKVKSKPLDLEMIDFKGVLGSFKTKHQLLLLGIVSHSVIKCYELGAFQFETCGTQSTRSFTLIGST